MFLQELFLHTADKWFSALNEMVSIKLHACWLELINSDKRNNLWKHLIDNIDFIDFKENFDFFSLLTQAVS